MKQQYIERPSPAYRYCVAISRISFYYEYPKCKDRFIWGIPSKYKKLLDQEISALCCCWIYDGTKKSLEAAKEIDSWFNGNPFKFIAKKEYNLMVMDGDQNRKVYNQITIKDCYYLFEWIYKELTAHQGIGYSISLMEGETPFDKMKELVKDIPRFSKKTINSDGRVNLYLFIMVHCLDRYEFDSSLLKAPLFEDNILPNCKSMDLVDNKVKDEDLPEHITNYLKWFSEKHPMTFWIGIAAYKEYFKDAPYFAKRFGQLKMTRHRFNKK